MMDSDGNGIIDANEFEVAIRRRGNGQFNFSKKFFKFIVDEIKSRTGQSGILFDNYIRISARFDYLCDSYKKTPYYQKHTLESYLKNTIFYNFW